MSERQVASWPKDRPPRWDKSGRRYRVRYDLAYDGGGAAWDGYYRTRLGARVAVWWNRHISSWGGTADLFDRSAQPEGGSL